MQRARVSNHPCHRLSVPAAKRFWCRHCMMVFEDAITRWRHSRSCRSGGFDNFVRRREIETQALQKMAETLDPEMVTQIAVKSGEDEAGCSKELCCFICRQRFVSLDEMREHVKYPCNKPVSLQRPSMTVYIEEPTFGTGIQQHYTDEPAARSQHSQHYVEAGPSSSHTAPQPVSTATSTAGTSPHPVTVYMNNEHEQAHPHQGDSEAKPTNIYVNEKGETVIEVENLDLNTKSGELSLAHLLTQLSQQGIVFDQQPQGEAEVSGGPGGEQQVVVHHSTHTQQEADYSQPTAVDAANTLTQLAGSVFRSAPPATNQHDNQHDAYSYQPPLKRIKTESGEIQYHAEVQHEEVPVQTYVEKVEHGGGEEEVEQEKYIICTNESEVISVVRAADTSPENSNSENLYHNGAVSSAAADSDCATTSAPAAVVDTVYEEHPGHGSQTLSVHVVEEHGPSAGSLERPTVVMLEHNGAAASTDQLIKTEQPSPQLVSQPQCAVEGEQTEETAAVGTHYPEETVPVTHYPDHTVAEAHYPDHTVAEAHYPDHGGAIQVLDAEAAAAVHAQQPDEDCQAGSASGGDPGSPSLHIAEVENEEEELIESQEEEHVSHTAEDVGNTAQDVGITSQDVSTTSQDVVIDNAHDVGTTSEEVIDTAHDVGTTSEEVIDTAHDVGTTSQDVIDNTHDVSTTPEDVIDNSHNISITSQDVSDMAQDVIVSNTAEDVSDTVQDVIVSNTAEDVSDAVQDVIVSNTAEDVSDAVQDVSMTTHDVGSPVAGDVSMTSNDDCAATPALTVSQVSVSSTPPEPHVLLPAGSDAQGSTEENDLIRTPVTDGGGTEEKCKKLSDVSDSPSELQVQHACQQNKMIRGRVLTRSISVHLLTQKQRVLRSRSVPALKNKAICRKKGTLVESSSFLLKNNVKANSSLDFESSARKPELKVQDKCSFSSQFLSAGFDVSNACESTVESVEQKLKDKKVALSCMRVKKKESCTPLSTTQLAPQKDVSLPLKASNKKPASGGRMFKCIICDALFSNPQGLRRHRQVPCRVKHTRNMSQKVLRPRRPAIVGTNNSRQKVQPRRPKLNPVKAKRRLLIASLLHHPLSPVSASKYNIKRKMFRLPVVALPPPRENEIRLQGSRLPVSSLRGKELAMAKLGLVSIGRMTPVALLQHQALLNSKTAILNRHRQEAVGAHIPMTSAALIQHQALLNIKTEPQTLLNIKTEHQSLINSKTDILNRRQQEAVSAHTPVTPPKLLLQQKTLSNSKTAVLKRCKQEAVSAHIPVTPAKLSQQKTLSNSKTAVLKRCKQEAVSARIPVTPAKLLQQKTLSNSKTAVLKRCKQEAVSARIPVPEQFSSDAPLGKMAWEAEEGFMSPPVLERIDLTVACGTVYSEPPCLEPMVFLSCQATSRCTVVSNPSIDNDIPKCRGSASSYHHNQAQMSLEVEPFWKITIKSLRYGLWLCEGGEIIIRTSSNQHKVLWINPERYSTRVKCDWDYK